MGEAHHHHAEDRSSFYLDQLFAIGVCGALATVTLILWMPLAGSVYAKFTHDLTMTFGDSSVASNRIPSLLDKMLHQKLHLWVMVGGVSLLVIVVLRAIAVWRSVDQQDGSQEHDASCDHGHNDEHKHEHGPECDHSHEHGHEHEHVTKTPAGSPTPALSLALAGGPAAAIPHSHGHGHSHSHSHGDHEHSWAPWRYVVLLLPVVLYFLVLSNPSFDRENVDNPTDALGHIQNFIVIFRSILWEALPFIVLGAVIAGLLEELLPQSVVESVLPKNRLLAIMMGGLLGLIFPMCECGIIPIMRRLLRKGLPLSCCVAYMLAGPIVNIVVILSTVAAFSGMQNVYEGSKPSYQMGSMWMTGLRVILGYLTAVVASLCVEWQYRKHGNSLLKPLVRPSEHPVEEQTSGEQKTVWQRVSNITETAMHDFVDITVFLIIGALLAASARIFITPDRMGELSRQHFVPAILLMMGLAIAVTLCSEADAFVAASFATLRPSAKLAFLVLGPMLDFKLYFMYTRIFRPRLIATIYIAIITQVFVYSLGVHYLWEKVIVPASEEARVSGTNNSWLPSWMLVHPNHSKAPAISEEEMKDMAARGAFRFLALPTPGTSAHVGVTASVGMMTCSPHEESMKMSFLALENASLTPEQREFYQNRRVYLEGRFVAKSPEEFTLIRYKINCCAADATPLNAAIFVEPKQSLPPYLAKVRDPWVRVTGRIRFYNPPGSTTWYVALVVTPTEREPLEKLIQLVPPDPNPFVY